MKYVFFDLDETLIDVKKAQNEGVRSLYKKYDFESKTDIDTFIKKWDELTDYHYQFYSKKLISYSEQRVRRVVDLFSSFNVKLDKEPLKVYDEYLEFFEAAWDVYDDVIETLTSLKNKGYELGLISNGDYDQQVQKVKKVGIFDMFTYINTSSQLEYSKPDKRVFESIFGMYNIPYNEVCYVGDSYKKDVLPCREIGVKGILIERKNKTYDDNELIIVNNLKDIIKIIDNDFNIEI